MPNPTNKPNKHPVMAPVQTKTNDALRVTTTSVPVREDEGQGFPFGQIEYDQVHVGASNRKHFGFDAEGWNSPDEWRAPTSLESSPTPQPEARGKALTLFSAIPYLSNMHSPSDHIMTTAYPDFVTAKDRSLARATGARHQFAESLPTPITQGYSGGPKEEDLHVIALTGRAMPQAGGPPSGQKVKPGGSGSAAGAGGGGGGSGTRGLGNCFSPNTIVVTKRGGVLFRDLQITDQVKTALGTWRKISGIFVHDHDGPMLKMADEDELITFHHLLQLRNGKEGCWLPALTVIGIDEETHYRGKVMNLEVEARDFNEKSFTLANGLVAHNKMPL